jgi:hypothetical protein
MDMDRSRASSPGIVMTILRALGRAWIPVARRIGHLQAYLMMTVVYFVFIAPFAYAARAFADPLSLGAGATWHPVAAPARADLNSVRLQY